MLYLSLKRPIDIGVSVTLIILTSPFFIFACLLTLLDRNRPLFLQQRIGHNGQEFTIYKFRTMRSAPQKNTPQHFKPDAPELTKIGRFLRNTSLDELPQLFNVLKGDMSLVGPRPHALEFAAHYASLAPRYYERYRVKPGLACIVEVTALHYRTEEADDIRARINCDLYYIDHISFMLDLKILWKMMLCVLTQNGNSYRAAKEQSNPQQGAAQPAHERTQAATPAHTPL